LSRYFGNALSRLPSREIEIEKLFYPPFALIYYGNFYGNFLLLLFVIRYPYGNFFFH